LANETITVNNHKTRVGVVVSDKMDKTVVVEIVRLYSHPLYKKRVKTTKRYKAHDENNECQVGDKVLIEECRPLSRDKSWKVIQIVEKAK
jgi:small subunit ribosomal protein S17